MENQEQQPKNVLIMGAGIIGLTSAYFLSKFTDYKVSVIDKDNPIWGASKGNAGTITLSSYSPWTTVNFWGVIKENLLMYKNPTSVLEYSLIFNKDFRFWLKKFMQNRDKQSVERGNSAILSLAEYSIKLFDDVTKEVSPDLDDIEYHEEPFINTQKKLTKGDINSQVTKFNRVREHGGEFTHLSNNQDMVVEKDRCSTYFDKDHKSGMFDKISTAYLFSCKVMNTFKFCQRMQEYLQEKHQVRFIQGDIKNLKCDQSSITGVEYQDLNGNTVIENQYDTYVVCAGTGSISIGKMLGLKVPMFGFKGHSLDIHVNSPKNEDLKIEV